MKENCTLLEKKEPCYCCIHLQNICMEFKCIQWYGVQMYGFQVWNVPIEGLHYLSKQKISGTLLTWLVLAAASIVFIHTAIAVQVCRLGCCGF